MTNPQSTAPRQRAPGAVPVDDLALFCPVPLLWHEAGAEVIDRAGSEWAVGHGLCAGGSLPTRSNIGLFIAAAMPFVTADAAATMSRYSYWAFLLDDHLDGLAGDPATAITLVGEANRIMYEPPAAPIPGGSPWLTSLRDLRAMMEDCLGSEGMDAVRSANTYWLSGQLWKLAALSRTAPTTVAEYLRMRWSKCGGSVLAAYTAPGAGYAMPAADLYEPRVRAFTSAVFQACTIVNDLVGFAREAATGQRDINIFSTLAAEHRLDPTSALLKAGELYERSLLLMTRLQQRLVADPRPAVARYAAELPQWVPATIHFTATSARYLTEHKPDTVAVPNVTTSETPLLVDPEDTTPPPYGDIAWWWQYLDH